MQIIMLHEDSKAKCSVPIKKYFLKAAKDVQYATRLEISFLQSKKSNMCLTFNVDFGIILVQPGRHFLFVFIKCYLYNNM